MAELRISSYRDLQLWEPACLLYVRDAEDTFSSEPVRIAGLTSRIDIPALSLSIPLDEIYRGLTGQG